MKYIDFLYYRIVRTRFFSAVEMQNSSSKRTLKLHYLFIYYKTTLDWALQNIKNSRRFRLTQAFIFFQCLYHILLIIVYAHTVNSILESSNKIWGPGEPKKVRVSCF